MIKIAELRGRTSCHIQFRLEGVAIEAKLEQSVDLNLPKREIKLEQIEHSDWSIAHQNWNKIGTRAPRTFGSDKRKDLLPDAC